MMASVVSLSKCIRCPHCGYKELERDAIVCPSCGIELEKAFSTVLKPGTVIGKHFEIDFVLGQGGFGVTYQAIDRALQRRVAIKEYFPREWAWRNTTNQSISVAPNNLDMYSRTLKKFEQEGQILANINHPGIVRVYSLFWDMGTVYLVMELLEGETLSQQLSRNKKFTEKEIREITKSLVVALHVLHKQGIQHLDIKPDNIMITKQKRVVLFDFGAARWDTTIEQNSQAKTITAYTPGYAPLELLQNAKATTTPATDIYELSVVIYELITGERPPDVLSRLNEQSWELRLPEGYERWLVGLQKGLEIYAEQRPQTVKQWWKLLEGHSDSVVTEVPVNERGKGITLPNIQHWLPDFSLLFGKRGIGLVLVGLVAVGGAGLWLIQGNDGLQRQWANSALENKNYEQAIELYNRIIQRTPGDAQLWAMRGNAYLGLKNYTLAINDYEQSLRLVFNSEVARQLAQANILQAEEDLKAGNHSLALQRIEKAVEMEPSLSASATQILFNAYVGAARARVASEDWVGAIQIYEDFLKRKDLDTKLATEVRQSLADVYHKLGQQQESQSQFENALISYNKGLENNPNSPELYVSKGNLLVRFSDFQGGLTQYNRAIQLDPSKGDYFARRGIVLGQLGKYNEALNDFEKAIQLGYREADVYNARGWIHIQMKSYGNAITDYNEAIRLNPRLALALVNRGWAKFFMNDYQGALQDFNSALTEQNNLAFAYHGAGYAKTMLKDSKTAIMSDLQQAIKLYTEEKNMTKVNEIKAWIQKHKLEE